MHRTVTAWTSSSAGSLPSDRIPPNPSRSPQPPTSANAKGKQNAKKQEPPKSAEVRRLSVVRDALIKAEEGREEGKGEEKQGCFCQARLHTLSSYTPLCQSCGLILCTLHPPHFPCPHCASPLLTPDARNALIKSLDAQITDVLAREEEARVQAAEAARRAAGEFPTLSAAAAANSRSTTPVQEAERQTHRVLSLKATKIMVSSYAPSRSSSRSGTSTPAREPEEREPERVPPPPSEVVCAPRAPGPERPWENFRGLNVTYIASPRAE
ncbi:hypothetical protein WOLCODRAFT_138749 [Wolfiporia cocos MD-104 SS10]|uniref:TRIP4/RQT4 C2HC5-type zinc finger domain-containing protein n=1 Tax=Wolfiporia cocos (strain MD-104) TaxID=742152 RepID=A0A2H3JP89_WOLCO|nr:hypothetical protein WOLCODRAFT_138749 [Wolfiporia cocos MD-104 SS10]